MIKRGIRILLVCDADDNIIGLLTSRDIAGDKPHRILAKAGGGVREDLRVSDVMTLRPELELLSMEDIQRARIGDLIATLRQVDRRTRWCWIVIPKPASRRCAVFSHCRRLACGWG